MFETKYIIAIIIILIMFVIYSNINTFTKNIIKYYFNDIVTKPLFNFYHRSVMKHPNYNYEMFSQNEKIDYDYLPYFNNSKKIKLDEHGDLDLSDNIRKSTGWKSSGPDISTFMDFTKVDNLHLLETAESDPTYKPVSSDETLEKLIR